MTDTHLHTLFSPDGKSEMAEMCSAAVSAGLSAICFTEHIDLSHPEPEFASPPDYAAFLTRIEQARAQFRSIDILAGIEIGDYFPAREQTREFLFKYSLDFHLLSLHVADGYDACQPEFFMGITREQAYLKYADALLESVRNFGAYDSLAHIGYVSKFAPYPPNILAYTHSLAPEINDEILRLTVSRGTAIEINTSGYPRMGQPIPGPDIIRRFSELGGEFVTFGSDAHSHARVGADIGLAHELALACGIRFGAVFKAHKVMPYPL